MVDHTFATPCLQRPLRLIEAGEDLAGARR
jgi:cystathionine beta-lyase/cystathionine gamma-synthase